MSEFDKLDNIDNMSDEEFDAFIKSELNASLMEDIKVDDELVCNTVKAALNAENEESIKWVPDDNMKNNKKVVSIKRYIPILSMVACACFIVMAGSLIYTKTGRKTSDNASVSSDKKQEATKNESFSENNSVYEEPESNNPENDLPQYDMENSIDGVVNNQGSNHDSVVGNDSDTQVDSDWSDTQVDEAPESSPENDCKEEIENLPDKNIFKIIFEIISSIFSAKDI